MSDLESSSPQYFGPPSPEIDLVWARLLLGEFPGISDDELRPNPGLRFEDQDRNLATRPFHIAIDIPHFLHCLNAVRKELDRDDYLASTVSDPSSLISNQSTATSTQRSRANHHSFWSAKSQHTHRPLLEPHSVEFTISSRSELCGNGEADLSHWRRILPGSC